MGQIEQNTTDREVQGDPTPGVQHFEIQIDRKHYTVTQHFLTGLQIRNVPSPPIGPDRDLFEVVPGGTDRKIADDEVVEIRNGLRFFSAPAQINPGGQRSGGGHLHAASR